MEKGGQKWQRQGRSFLYVQNSRAYLKKLRVKKLKKKKTENN